MAKRGAGGTKAIVQAPHAYASVGLLLMGGISALPLLAVERARRVRARAAVAVSGVVASLSLAVALTVVVASFRGAVNLWLALRPRRCLVPHCDGAGRAD